MSAISSLAGLLSLCGISSVRMFAPTFLFGTICRFMPAYDWCPEGIRQLAESCPSFLTSGFGLCVFGVLGVLEVIANWDDSVRELISESNIETYVKPVFATLMAYSILTPEQIQVVTAAVGDVTSAVPLAAGPVSNVVSPTVSAVPSGLDVATVSNAVVESAGVVALGASKAAAPESGLSFWAIVGSLFCCGGTFGLCKVRAGIVAAVREFDPDNALHLNTLLTLFEEGSWLAILPVLLVFPLLALLLMLVLAVFGWLLSRPLKKIAEKRRAHWDAMGKDGMLRAVRTRAIVIFLLGILLSAVPVFGYVATVLALNLFVFGVLSLYEKRSTRIFAKIAMRFIKLTIFLVAVVFSSIPFVGVVLLVPYVVSYMIRVNALRHT